MSVKSIGLCGLLLVAMSVSAAMAVPIPLQNADIETNPDNAAQFSGIAPWGPNGGWAFHTGFDRPGREALGERFGFYSAGTLETVGQLTAELIAPGSTYTFRSFINDGGTPGGAVPYQIGYAGVTGDRSSFIPLATNVVDISGSFGGAWMLADGVTYTVGTEGAEIGKELIVRLGSGADGGLTDAWFDNLSLTRTGGDVIPEPGTMALLATSLLGLAGFRRIARG